jgi:hypothetical protein
MHACQLGPSFQLCLRTVPLAYVAMDGHMSDSAMDELLQACKAVMAPEGNAIDPGLVAPQTPPNDAAWRPSAVSRPPVHRSHPYAAKPRPPAASPPAHLLRTAQPPAPPPLTPRPPPPAPTAHVLQQVHAIAHELQQVLQPPPPPPALSTTPIRVPPRYPAIYRQQPPGPPAGLLAHVPSPQQQQPPPPAHVPWRSRVPLGPPRAKWPDDSVANAQRFALLIANKCNPPPPPVLLQHVPAADVAQFPKNGRKRRGGVNSQWHTAWHRAKAEGPQALALFNRVWPKGLDD